MITESTEKAGELEEAVQELRKKREAYIQRARGLEEEHDWILEEKK